jgi:hypothetical protein
MHDPHSQTGDRDRYRNGPSFAHGILASGRFGDTPGEFVTTRTFLYI